MEPANSDSSPSKVGWTVDPNMQPAAQASSSPGRDPTNAIMPVVEASCPSKSTDPYAATSTSTAARTQRSGPIGRRPQGAAEGCDFHESRTGKRRHSWQVQSTQSPSPGPPSECREITGPSRGRVCGRVRDRDLGLPHVRRSARSPVLQISRFLRATAAPRTVRRQSGTRLDGAEGSDRACRRTPRD